MSAARRTVMGAVEMFDGTDRYLDTRAGTPLGSGNDWITIRTTILALAAAVFLVLHPLDHHLVIGAVLATAAVLQPLLGRVLPPTWMSMTQSVGDIVVIGAATAIAPAVWPGALVWLGGVVGYQLLTAPRRQSAPFGIAAVATVATVGWAADIVNWWLASLTLAFVGLAFLLIGESIRRDISENELELLSTISAAGAIVHRSDLRHASVNTVHGDVEALTGWTREEWASLDHREVVHPDDLDTYWLEADDVEPDTIVDRVARIRRPDGTYVWIRDVVRVAADRDGELYMRGLTIDVTHAEESNRRIREQALLDTVTALPNRLAMMEHLERLLADDTPFALVMIDLDRFKEVNDTLGHEVGDFTLEVVARRLAATIGPDDHLSRLGGDEYAIIVPGARTPDDLRTFLDDVAARCAEPILVRGIRFAVAISTGVSFRSAGSDRPTLLRHADIAMYEAKRDGAAYRFFDDSLEQSSTMQLSLSASLPEAIRNGEITLLFQPKIDLRTGHVVGAEGLVRWDHPEFGRLTPNHFLDLAVMSESTIDFTLATVEQAITMIRRLTNLGFTIPIAANISVRSLGDVNFARSIVKLLRHHGVSPELLTLELTENDVQYPSDEMRRRLVELREAGVSLSIDDFGTGHSSLHRISTLSVDELKIDRSFVSSIVDQPRDRHIVQTIIDLADRLGYSVIAEGVERDDQARLLAEMGCPQAQGFLYDPALDAADFVERVLADAVIGDVPEPGAWPEAEELIADDRGTSVHGEPPNHDGAPSDLDPGDRTREPVTVDRTSPHLDPMQPHATVARVRITDDMVTPPPGETAGRRR